MRARFIGQPGDDLPDEHTFRGVVFPKGKFVEIPPELEARITGNSHFETQGDSTTRTLSADNNETVPELSERIAEMDDVDALKAELKRESRVTAQRVIEARIAALSAPATE